MSLKTPVLGTVVSIRFYLLKNTLVDVYVDLVVFTRIAGTSDLDDRYSNLFLNAYINRHAHTEYFKMI